MELFSWEVDLVVGGAFCPGQRVLVVSFDLVLKEEKKFFGFYPRGGVFPSLRA